LARLRILAEFDAKRKTPIHKRIAVESMTRLRVG